MPFVVRRLACRMGLLVAAIGVGMPGRAADAPESATLRKIRETGVITLGYRVNSVPFSYLDERRRPIGYSIEICSRIADTVRARLNRSDIETRLVMVTSTTRLPLLANGSIDLECGTTTNTAERQKMVAFSVTTFVAASRLLTKRGSDVHVVEDLRGQTVTTTLSTTSIQYLTRLNDELGLNMRILAGADDADAFNMVRNGSAVAFAMDDVLLRSLIATASDGHEYGISEATLTTEPYAIVMQRGDPAFKRLVDEVIVGLFRSGAIETIYRRWFESVLPQRNINLRLPMSEALKRVIAQPTDSPDPRVYR